MARKFPEGVRMPPVDRPEPKTHVPAGGTRQRQLVTGNAAKRKARSHPLKG